MFQVPILNIKQKTHTYLKGFKSGLFNFDDFLIISEGTKELSLKDFTNTSQQELVGGNILELRLIILGEDSEGHVIRKRWVTSGDVMFPLDVLQCHSAS